MSKKVIAIGNEMMTDDGIGICVAKELEDYMKSWNIELIIGETDVEYCLDYIGDGDDLIILDAAFQEDSPGTICTYPLEELFLHRAVITQHQPSLLDAIRLYKMGVKGILITIEIAELSFGLGLSERMKGLLPQIVVEVRNLIDEYIGG